MSKQKVKNILQPVLHEKEDGWKAWAEGYVSACAGCKFITEEESEELMEVIVNMNSLDYINTVEQLIAHLQQFPADKDVMLSDECGSYGLPKSAVKLWDDNNADSPLTIFAK